MGKVGWKGDNRELFRRKVGAVDLKYSFEDEKEKSEKAETVGVGSEAREGQPKVPRNESLPKAKV